ncbi:phospholipase D gamma 1-like isoform X1 [Rosa rugosa]|uniref:phospholipase D gamma 1-like isoform X1 n=1 Tax=Rosa rugosa TaxID=74645 RepID=UPI002B413832|nr:phospholipase D gamma 1-like isoform X1 [Rosa rugosa]
MANLGYKESLSFGGSGHAQGQQVVPFESGALKLLLHGSLVICVKEAKNLPDMDGLHKHMGRVISKLPGRSSKKTTSAPYVTIALSGAVVGRTFVISNSQNPVWNQHFDVPVAHHASEVHFVVKHSDVVGSQTIGSVGIPVEELYAGVKIEGTFPILNSTGHICMPGVVLSLSIQYTSIQKMTFCNCGVGSDPDHQGVPGTYFPVRKGGKVTLYQDAHVPDGCLPNFELDGGLEYEHGNCWQDIFDAISKARHLIYITGWSLCHKVTLVRDNHGASDCTLGDLLKTKSQEGVRVLLLVWDDPTSRNIMGSIKGGLMHTNDEELRRFFKNSSVQVLLCPRSAGEGTWAKKQEAGIIYTHHQKTVLVDADAGQYKRKIIAFVGGLDLCLGRYDTPEHPIFSTLQTVHKDDNHNPTFSKPVIGCPREPWHDLHSKIDGPAAYDILTNFEQRWGMASKPQGLHKLKERGLQKLKVRGLHKLETQDDGDDDALLKTEKIPKLIGMTEVSCLSEDDKEAWDVQVFRSIDSNSAKGFPEDPKDATSVNLVCGKNVLIDMSIHAAYVKAIRAAQHFIYIENQYFLGSSYNWNLYNDLGANNLIPMEIALKIVNKIKANEKFSVYIIIPMWPEGDPTSVPLQRILLWQHKTMQMMYEMIYKALKEVGLENTYSPQDYLNFFCLGNRETLSGEDNSAPNNLSEANTPQALTLKNRRFMIYVHSKGMIVDDEYVILGSANINQRSMEGPRDTEIAMGAYQPHHTWTRKLSSPHGKVYGYRMSLWAEHIGLVEECFKQPESLECVRRVRSLSEQNWSQYVADEVTEMKGHLLKYPVEVGPTGEVEPLPGCAAFPDVGGYILGSLGDIGKSLGISSINGRGISFRAMQENLTI